ncbi:MAG: HU family DNA-binding protein [Patescibacteria group bacterium]
MNKATLAHLIATRVGLSKTQGEAVISALVSIVIDTLKKGEEVTISGFGEWSARTRAGRIGVNPRNIAEKITIPPVKVAKFKAGKVLKESLKGSGN